MGRELYVWCVSMVCCTLAVEYFVDVWRERLWEFDDERGEEISRSDDRPNQKVSPMALYLSVQSSGLDFCRSYKHDLTLTSKQKHSNTTPFCSRQKTERTKGPTNKSDKMGCYRYGRHYKSHANKCTSAKFIASQNSRRTHQHHRSLPSIRGH